MGTRDARWRPGDTHRVALCVDTDGRSVVRARNGAYSYSMYGWRAPSYDPCYPYSRNGTLCCVSSAHRTRPQPNNNDKQAALSLKGPVPLA